MALEKQNFVLTYTIEDSNGNASSSSFYAPSTTSEADLAAVADDIYALIDPLIQGQLLRYQFSSIWKEGDYVQPTLANGNAEDAAVFTFTTNKQSKVSLKLPTFDPSLTLDENDVPYSEARQIVDVNHVNVAPFVAGMIAGFTDGTVNIYPSGRKDELGDIIALHSANYVQYGSRERTTARG
jgi:hypothetical protein